MFKKINLLALLIVMCGTFSAFAQSEKLNAIKINPLSLIVSTVNVQYQRQYDPTHGFQIGVYFLGRSFGDTKFTGLGITPEFRWYFASESNMAGFYLGPYVRYENFSLTSTYNQTYYNNFGQYTTTTEASATLTGLGGGAVVGKQWVWGSFTLDCFAGLGFTTYGVSIKSGSESAFTLNNFGTGVGLGRTGIALGFAF
jgi:hypothetical protein